MKKTLTTLLSVMAGSIAMGQFAPYHLPHSTIEEADGEVFLHFTADDVIKASGNRLITTDVLGTTIVSECIYEQPDGTPYLLDSDYFGKQREAKPIAGPFAESAYSKVNIKIW